MKRFHSFILQFTLSICLAVLFLSCQNKSMPIQKEEVREFKDGDIMEMNSTEFLLHNHRWDKKETTHFNFYFDESIQAEEQEEVVKTQEKNYTRILSQMGEDLEIAPTINFWVFKDNAQKERLTKVPSDAHAISTFPSVYQLPFNAKGAQEIGHVLTQKLWGFIPKTSNYATVIDEGFNYYIDEGTFYEKPLYETAQDLLIYADYGIEDIATDNGGLRRTGVATGSHGVEESQNSGAFVKYLIDNYSIEKFATLWKLAAQSEKAEPEIFETVYGKSLHELDKEFTLFLFDSQLTDLYDEDDETTYFFVRHAEKAVDGTKNPHLTEQGRERALRLIDHLKHYKFDAVYSTNYHRTIETAEPIAKSNQVEITIYDPKFDLQQFMKETKGKTVLVVGHSNTIPDYVNYLIGEPKYDEIDEGDYGNLFMITIKEHLVVEFCLTGL